MEKQSSVKHKHFNGLIYPLHYNPTTNMIESSDAHVAISLNTSINTKKPSAWHSLSHLCLRSVCRVKANNKTSDKAYFYPDVMVTCDPDDRGRKTIKESPTLVIEVLSKSTRNYERGDKFFIYRSLPSLREYVLIYPDQFFVEVFRLNEHQRWELFSFEGAESNVEFTSVDLHCTMNELYEDVDFAE